MYLKINVFIKLFHNEITAFISILLSVISLLAVHACELYRAVKAFPVSFAIPMQSPVPQTILFPSPEWLIPTKTFISSLQLWG